MDVLIVYTNEIEVYLNLVIKKGCVFMKVGAVIAVLQSETVWPKSQVCQWQMDP